MKLHIELGDQGDPSVGIGPFICTIKVEDNLIWTGDMKALFIEFLSDFYDIPHENHTIVKEED